MMKTNRSLSVFLIAVMLVGLCACGSKEGNAKGNGEYKLYTGNIDVNISSVIMIPLGILISIFLIHEIFGKNKEKAQEEHGEAR